MYGSLSCILVCLQPDTPHSRCCADHARGDPHTRCALVVLRRRLDKRTALVMRIAANIARTEDHPRTVSLCCSCVRGPKGVARPTTILR